MKIKKIEVVKLFGLFNHSIPLMDDGITIVIGENGLGKTVMLEAVNAFFEKNYAFFERIEFESFAFYFDHNDFLEITKKQGGLYAQKFFQEKDTKTKATKIADFGASKKNRAFSERLLHKEILLKRFELEKNMRLAEVSDSIDARYREVALRNLLIEDFENHKFSTENADAPKWLSDVQSKVNIRLIETQRLITAKTRGSESYTNTVTKSSKELSDRIYAIEKMAAEIATRLDSTYPNRLIKKIKQNTSSTFEELNDALQKLDGRRKLLSLAGILVNSEDADVFQIQKSDEGLINVLKLYIDDSNQKLAPYDDISRRIRLFLDILNKRFKHKTLEISKKDGFKFKSNIKKNSNGDPEEIQPSKLSSGEQNELILFYELIFNSNEGDTILIDEPELSLHISWQNKFIADLKDVTSMNKVAIIIATHSPDIINENWDLRVELEGLE